MESFGSSAHEPSNDEQLAQVVRQYGRIRWVMVIIAGAAVFTILAALGYQQYMTRQQIAKDEIRLQASCQVAADIATAPLTISPETKKPTILGVKLLVDFRNAYIGQGCPGHLPPIEPLLAQWASRYGITIREGT